MVCNDRYTAKNSKLILHGEEVGYITGFEMTIAKEFAEKDVLGRPVAVEIPIRNNLTGSIERIMLDLELLGLALGRTTYNTTESFVEDEFFDSTNICLWKFVEDRQVITSDGTVVIPATGVVAQLTNAKGENFAESGLQLHGYATDVTEGLEVNFDVLFYEVDTYLTPDNTDFLDAANLIASGNFAMPHAASASWQTFDLSTLTLGPGALINQDNDSNPVWMLIRNANLSDGDDTITLSTRTSTFNPTGDFPSTTFMTGVSVNTEFVDDIGKTAIAFLNMYERTQDGFDMIVEIDGLDEVRFKFGEVRFRSNSFTLSPTDVTLDTVEWIADKIYFWDSGLDVWVLAPDQ